MHREEIQELNDRLKSLTMTVELHANRSVVVC